VQLPRLGDHLICQYVKYVTIGHNMTRIFFVFTSKIVYWFTNAKLLQLKRRAAGRATIEVNARKGGSCFHSIYMYVWPPCIVRSSPLLLQCNWSLSLVCAFSKGDVYTYTIVVVVPSPIYHYVLRCILDGPTKTCSKACVFQIFEPFPQAAAATYDSLQRMETEKGRVRDNRYTYYTY
jgi:hypothetical protein